MTLEAGFHGLPSITPMRARHPPIRLFAEIFVVVALVHLGIAATLPALAGPAGSWGQAGLGALLLLLLSGPWVFWRCMVAVRLPGISAESGDEAGKGRGAAGGNLRQAVAMTAAAQLVGLALTGVVFVWQQRSIEGQSRVRFDRGVERIEAEVRRRFELPLASLLGARGMYAATTQVSRDTFRAYFENRNLGQEIPGVRSYGFVQQVAREDVGRFVAAEQADHADRKSVV
mgnify:CR=1 FL=1